MNVYKNYKGKFFFVNYNRSVGELSPKVSRKLSPVLSGNCLEMQCQETVLSVNYLVPSGKQDFSM